MTYTSGTGNRLLAALRPADFDLLANDIQTVALNRNAVLARAGDKVEYVFPHNGAIPLMIDMPNG